MILLSGVMQKFFVNISLLWIVVSRVSTLAQFNTTTCWCQVLENISEVCYANFGAKQTGS